MKRLIIALLVFASLPALSQSLEFTEYDVDLALEEVLDYNQIIATNTSAFTKTYAMRLEKRCYNGDDELGLQICWGALCYPPTNDDLTTYENENILVTLDPGESTGEFSIHQFWYLDYGSDWRLYFYDLNDPSDETYLDIAVGDCLEEDVVISVEEIVSTPSLAFYPNPADKVLNLQIDEWTGGLSVFVYDITGQVVLNHNLLDSQIRLDVSDLPAGIYMVQLSNSLSPLSTQRLLIN